jgi:uncharacterized protein with HEPN domain
MRPDERDAALLWDMVVHARELVAIFGGRGLAEYRGDRLLRLATERMVQIIGEAAYKVSQPYRAANPQVPWVPIIKQRHVLVHDYGVIDDEKIWRVATVYVPELIPLIEALLPPPPPNPLPELPEPEQGG